MDAVQNMDRAYAALFSEMRAGWLNMDLVATAKDEARAALGAAVAAAAAAGALPGVELPPYVVEIPADTAHGDLAANLALVSAKALSMPPRKIAEAVAAHFPCEGIFEKIEVAGPGFINLFLGEAWFSSVVMAACATGDDYGRTTTGGGEKVNVEFVSANPTGPMHLGNARGGALGDTLAEVMNWAGYDAAREFYTNDAGNQIAKFGKSLAARYLQIVKGEDAVPFPEDGYHGGDIKMRAQEFHDRFGAEFAEKPEEEREAALVAYALPLNIEAMKADLEKYRIHYDVWFFESALHMSGAVANAVKQLGERGATYEKDGAIWYKSPDADVEKDEVLVRANGVPTYFAADIAYHADKFARGFERLVDVWGADHHGHVARMKGALTALGLPGDKLDIILMQFVKLVRQGEAVRMSKRTGEAITLSDLLDDIPVDSARFFFVMREPGSQIELDLDLAVKEDSENPVYYVQYAHARVCSILRTLEGEGVQLDFKRAFGALPQLAAPEERELVRLVAGFPSAIVAAAAQYDPARITQALTALSAAFHRFYTACRIKGAEDGLQQARLALCFAAKIVIANGLGILKVSAPESM